VCLEIEEIFFLLIIFFVFSIFLIIAFFHFIAIAIFPPSSFDEPCHVHYRNVFAKSTIHRALKKAFHFALKSFRRQQINYSLCVMCVCRVLCVLHIWIYSGVCWIKKVIVSIHHIKMNVHLSEYMQYNII